MGLNTRQIFDAIQPLTQANHNPIDLDRVLDLLLTGDMELQGLFTWRSNYTFLVKLTRPPEAPAVAGHALSVTYPKSPTSTELLAVYKPSQGERPLWDFPEGDLGRREFASYLVSRVLGWPRVPPTVWREDGPHGPGSVQFYIDAEVEAHYFNLRDLPAYTDDFRRMALFDYLVNNADRKGGHCLKDKEGQIWAIDHGLTFHVERKLRTVIWEFANEKIDLALLNDLKRLSRVVDESGELYPALTQVISPAEMRAFQRRINHLLKTGCFPSWTGGYDVPYPPL